MDNEVLRGTGHEAGQWSDVGLPRWDRELVVLQRHRHLVSQQCWFLPHDGAKRPGISCGRGPWPCQGLLHPFAVYPKNQSKGTGSMLLRGSRLQAREDQHEHGGLQAALLGDSEPGAL